ncbi:hypothetical protein PK21_gp13 [Geobacillus phage vB_GthS_PK2.1]|nr:hypothetical protein PK21_gp13 [Geobacillus phage vB_GthS_PK2.1]
MPKYIAKRHLVTRTGIKKPGDVIEYTKEQAQKLLAAGFIEEAEEEKKTSGKGKQKADEADKADK